MSEKQPNQPLKTQAKTELELNVISIIEQHYSGPLPPPQALERYNNIIPNGAERIMVMAEKQGDHRQALETKALNTDSRNSFLGIWAAFIIGMSTIIIGGIVILYDHEWSGGFLGFVGLGGLVYAFIYGTKQRRAERETKSRTS